MKDRTQDNDQSLEIDVEGREVKQNKSSRNNRNSEPTVEPTPIAENTTNMKKAYMYLGPNLPGGILFSGALFKCNSLDEIVHLRESFEKVPEIKELFVEVTEVPKIKRELLEQGTGSYRLYQIIKGAIKNGI